MQLEQDEKGPFLSDETPACDKNRQPPPTHPPTPEETQACDQQCPVPVSSWEGSFSFSHQKVICLKVSRPNGRHF